MRVYFVNERGQEESAELPVVNGFGKFEHEPRIVAVLFNFWKNSGETPEVTGTHCRFLGPFELGDIDGIKRALPFVSPGASMTREERLFLRSCAGVIIGELSDGFIVSRLFGSRTVDYANMDREWDAIRSFDPDYGEDEEAESGD